MLKLYLIRHGETDYNLRNVVQGGGIDSDLNDTGRGQAEAFHRQYRHLHFDGIYSSGLRRTFQTLAPFEETHGPVIRLPQLNELNWGVLEGMEASDMIRREYEHINSAWDAGQLEAATEQGESPAAAWERLSLGVEEIRRKHGDRGNVLVCTHGRVLRILLSELLGYGMRQMNRFPHTNTALNQIVLSPNGKWFAERLNDTSHLGE